MRGPPGCTLGQCRGRASPLGVPACPGRPPTRGVRLPQLRGHPRCGEGHGMSENEEKPKKPCRQRREFTPEFPTSGQGRSHKRRAHRLRQRRRRKRRRSGGREWIGPGYCATAHLYGAPPLLAAEALTSKIS